MGAADQELEGDPKRTEDDEDSEDGDGVIDFDAVVETDERLEETKARNLLLIFVIRVYRPLCCKFITSRFCTQGPSLQESMALPYEELSLKLRTPTLMKVSNKMFQRVVRLLNWNRAGNPRISGKVDVRIFLSAYIVASE
jgi:hypothetical protein